MADYDPDRPNVATGRGSVKPKKGKDKRKPKGRYDWGDGKGRVHSIPLSEHEQNVKARGYGINLDDPLSNPLTNRQAFGIAEAGADRVYGPQIQAQETLNRSIPGWYENYVNTVGTQRAAAQAFAQGYTQAAQQAVTNAGQTAPGLDPSSPQAQAEQQAAQGRQAITQASANALAAIPVSTDNAYGNAIVLAQREMPQLQAYGIQQLGGLRSQRGQAVVEGYGQQRQAEQNAQIAYGTLGLNTQKATDDVADDIRRSEDKRKQRKATARAQRRQVNKYGYTNADWQRMSTQERQKVIRDFDESGSSGKTAEDRAEEKRIAGIRKDTGAFKSRISDAVGDWDMLQREVVTEEYEVPDPKNPNKTIKKTRPRKSTGGKPTPDEIRRVMRKRGYTPQEIHIALLRRVNKPLDRAAIDYMHSKGLRIPRDWLPKKIRTSTGRPAHADDGSGQQRPT